MNTYNNGPGNIPRLPARVVDTLIDSAGVSRLAPHIGSSARDQSAQVERLVHDACEELLARLPASLVQGAASAAQPLDLDKLAAIANRVEARGLFNASCDIRDWIQEVHATQARATLAERAQAAQPSGAVYQLWLRDFPETWADASKEEFDSHSGHKRVVYATPAPEQEAAQPTNDAISLLRRLVSALDGKRAAGMAGEPGFEFNDQLWALLEPARALTAPVEQEAAQVSPSGAQEIHFFRMKGINALWTEISANHMAAVKRGPGVDAFEYRTLYTAPVAQEAEQPCAPSPST